MLDMYHVMTMFIIVNNALTYAMMHDSNTSTVLRAEPRGTDGMEQVRDRSSDCGISETDRLPTLDTHILLTLTLEQAASGSVPLLLDCVMWYTGTEEMRACLWSAD